MSITSGDIIIIVTIIVALIGAGLYFLNRWASNKMSDQEELISRSKQTISIYVIDKKIMKAKNSSLPKMVIDQLPKYYKFKKIPLVKAKVGATINTFMCDKKVYNALVLKKNTKVDIAGVYIMNIPGLKTKKEINEIKKAKKANKAKK